MFEQFKNRYLITGKLSFDTPLHIGSGIGSTETDSTVVKYFGDKPYIPGSSFKGVLRSTIERIALALGLDTCSLFSDINCNKFIEEEMQKIKDGKSTLRSQPFDLPNDENDYVNFLLTKVLRQIDSTTTKSGLCLTCKLFGSTYLASKVLVDDLTLVNRNVRTEIRDGVGIDRDTGTAVVGVKYDYEVIPQQKFKLNLTVENVEFDPSGKSMDLLLLAIGFSEFIQGTKMGGLTSRGLGSCKIEDGKISWLIFDPTVPSDKQKFLSYLRTGNYPGGQQKSLEEFINTQIAQNFPSTS
jgi:CRISPR-associated RAMP protein (TIGR02581 family)